MRDLFERILPPEEPAEDAIARILGTTPLLANELQRMASVEGQTSAHARLTASHADAQAHAHLDKMNTTLEKLGCFLDIHPALLALNLRLRLNFSWNTRKPSLGAGTVMWTWDTNRATAYGETGLPGKRRIAIGPPQGQSDLDAEAFVAEYRALRSLLDTFASSVERTGGPKRLWESYAALPVGSPNRHGSRRGRWQTYAHNPEDAALFAILLSVPASEFHAWAQQGGCITMVAPKTRGVPARNLVLTPSLSPNGPFFLVHPQANAA